MARMPQSATDAATGTTEATEGRGIQAVVAVVVQIVVAVVYSWSVMRGPLTALHGWSKAETIAPYRYNLILVSIGAILGGFLQDRKGSRLVASIGGLLLAIGCIICALFGDTMGGLILGYGVLGGFGSGFAYVTPIANLVKWFPDKRGTMVGLAVMGSGMSTLFWSPLIEQFVGHDATSFHNTIPRTFFIMAAIFAVAIIGAAQFYRVPPAGWRPASWHPPVEVIHREVSSRTMLGTWQFYALWTMFVLGASVGLTAIGQASQLIQEVARSSAPISVGVAVGLMGVFNGSGRLDVGNRVRPPWQKDGRACDEPGFGDRVPRVSAHGIGLLGSVHRSVPGGVRLRRLFRADAVADRGLLRPEQHRRQLRPGILRLRRLRICGAGLF